MGPPASPLLTIVVHDSARGTVGTEGRGRKRKRPGDEAVAAGGGCEKVRSEEAFAVLGSPRRWGMGRAWRRPWGSLAERPRRGGTLASDRLCGEEGAVPAGIAAGGQLGGCSAVCTAPAPLAEPAEMAAAARRASPAGPAAGSGGSCPADSRFQPLRAQPTGRSGGERLEKGGVTDPAAPWRRVTLKERGVFLLRRRRSPARGRLVWCGLLRNWASLTPRWALSAARG